MSKIYIVMGQTGEYSDAHCWPVKAFHKEEDAIQIARKMNNIVQRLLKKKRLSWSHIYSPGSSDEMVALRVKLETEYRKFDEKFHFDYNGTTYYYDEIPAKLRS